MGKVLLLVVLALVVYALWRGAKRVGTSDRGSASPRPDAGSAATGPERMVCCERCRVHLPVGEAVLAEGRYYCSEEHARLTGAA
jgi:uncharacterized protein